MTDLVPLLQEFGWDRASIAMAISLYLLLQAATTPVQGELIDRYGPRRVLLVSLVVIACAIAGLRGVDRPTLVSSTLLTIGYLALRHAHAARVRLEDAGDEIQESGLPGT